MKKLFNFHKFIIEKVQTEWFDKNPDFYLSKNKEYINKKKENDKKDVEYQNEQIKKLKKLSISQIKFIKEKDSQIYHNFDYDILFRIYDDEDTIYFSYKNYLGELNYKFVLAFMELIYDKNKGYVFENISGIDQDIVNGIFNATDEYYGIYYLDEINYNNKKLYLTLNNDLFKTKIKEIKEKNGKIIYFNNKTLGKEGTNFENIKLNKVINELKKISYKDIRFINKQKNYYSVIFPEKIQPIINELRLISNPFFQKETINYDKIYFGHFKNRFHALSINKKIQGIGLGYKIYKAFLKYQGYLISDEQSSPDARKVYYNLLKDDDIYYIVEKDAPEKNNTFSKDSSKILLIWKDNPNLQRIVKLIRQHELSSGRIYEYDKEILKYIE